MGQMLVDVIFKVLNFLASVLLAPLYSAVSVLFPTLSTFFTNVLGFINQSTNYVLFFIKLLMIPPGCISVLFGLALTIFVFNTTIRIYGLGIAIYKWFKP